MLPGRSFVIARHRQRSMRTLKFTYRMELRFSSPVSRHYFALRCIPKDSPRQKIHLTRREVEPAEYLDELEDGFQNLKLTGGCLAPHSFFRFHVEGTAEVEGMGFQEEPLHPMYRYPSRYTAFEPEVAEFAERAMERCREAKAEKILEKAVCVMDYLHANFAYVPGITNIGTTAAEALRMGKGVCQDYAHIMTAVMRYMGIPARYVNGLMIGEGFIHAWVEVYTEKGWYGLDPTNRLHIDDYYIVLAKGRDYGDCPVDKGCFFGNAAQQQNIYVNVEEMEHDRDRGINGTAGG